MDLDHVATDDHLEPLQCLPLGRLELVRDANQVIRVRDIVRFSRKYSSLKSIKQPIPDIFPFVRFGRGTRS